MKVNASERIMVSVARSIRRDEKMPLA